MELKELLDAANEGYPDGYLSHYYDSNGDFVEGNGDTLARFIVIEIIETYAPSPPDEKQLDTAIKAMDRAEGDIKGVIKSLKRKRKPLKWAVREATGTGSLDLSSTKPDGGETP